jgi:hypothetical protein
VIIASFPEVLADFRRKRWSLLWRGTRDGFSAFDFHSRCDGYPNTLTLILDAKGNIFGGFTPVKWESDARGKCKGDPSLKSFIFSLKNPHNVPAARFALKPKKKDEAIFCDSETGPNFTDIQVSDECNLDKNSYASNFGSCYTNDTGLDGKKFFTASQYFRVSEIEVFAIIT